MESLFLVNPGKRKRKRKSGKGRMPPALRRYWAAKRAAKSGRRKRRKVSVKSRMANPGRRKHRRARRRNPVYSRRRRKVYASKRRRNPVRHRHHARRHRHHARRRNPFGGSEIQSVVMPALVGAGGAIALAVAYGYLSPNLPSALTSGFMPTAVQAAAALGLGFLAGKFLGRSQGNAVAVGALTVIAVNAVTPYISSATGGNVPGMNGLGGLKLGGVGDFVPYRRPIGAYTPNVRNMPGSGMGRLGYVSPASRIGAYARVPIGAYARGIPTMGAIHQPADYSGGSGYTGMNDGM
jgi:hypothetical protein